MYKVLVCSIMRTQVFTLVLHTAVTVLGSFDQRFEFSCVWCLMYYYHYCSLLFNSEFIVITSLRITCDHFSSLVGSPCLCPLCRSVCLFMCVCVLFHSVFHTYHVYLRSPSTSSLPLSLPLALLCPHRGLCVLSPLPVPVSLFSCSTQSPQLFVCFMSACSMSGCHNLHLTMFPVLV